MILEEYQKYIYGSADVVGLMCLNVFVEEDMNKFHLLKPKAMALGRLFKSQFFKRS